MLRIVSLFILTFVCFNLKAQSPADWWFFGQNAGVHFTSGGPVADTNGQMVTQEGCASVSSSDGDLLFYTDGLKVWDASHTVMPNGDSLYGNGSSTQAAVIVPYPGNPNKYYIFTVSGCTGGTYNTGNHYFAYSVVDMNLNTGLGDVLGAQKNVVLFDSASERCTAALHANGNDIWVIGKQENSNKYYSFHLANSGIVDTVITEVGLVGGCVGYMLANHAGDQIVVGNYGASVEVFGLNQSTGVLDSVLTLTPGAYGVHFSPSDELLYTASLTNIFQYDLTAANVQGSQFSVTTVSGLYTIAEGPDEKLYTSKYQTSYLARINDPNQLGAACNFQDSAVYLEGRICRVGLPNHVAAGLFLIGDIDVDGRCFGDSTFFTVDTTNADSVRWNFGDPSTGVLNQSTAFSDWHLYSDTGEFLVTLIVYKDSLIDTAYQTVMIYPYAVVDLGPDTIVCRGTELIFSAAQPYAQFLWHDTTSADTFLTTGENIVWAQVSGYCDTVSDTIFISYDDTIEFDLGPDTLLCGGTGYFIDANVQENAIIQWNTGDSVDAITVTESGIYEMNAVNTCGSVNDTIKVTFKPIPSLTLLPADTLNCFDKAIVLTRPDLDSTTFIWSDSTKKKTYTVDSTETVWLAAFNECGSSIDTINIVFNGEIKSELGTDTIICNLDSLVLNAYQYGATYIWNTGDTADSIVSGTKSQLYIVTITLRECQTIESRRVDLSDVFCPGIDCRLHTMNVFTPNGDGVNDIWRASSDCEILSYQLNIYNRWGQLVHSSANAEFGWDGFIDGVPASEGTYFFELQFRDTVVVDVDRQGFKGSITLQR